MNHTENLSEKIISMIKAFIISSPENTLKNKDNEKAFEDVLVGFSSGNDPLYEAYKEHVGQFHWTPMEIFSMTFPEIEVSPDELTVISWILPHKKVTKEDNRNESTFPAERWARARIFGEAFNVKLKKHLTTFLNETGHPAIAPPLSPEWDIRMSDTYVFASNWSERHAAYAAGLGTFGLCDALITKKGKAMRAGSVISRIKIPPTPRPYTDHHEYCLFFTHGTCGKCIKRCPVSALSHAGHDKVKCLQHLKPVTEDYVKKTYQFDGYGCGLCQTGVPCESGIPGKKDG